MEVSKRIIPACAGSICRKPVGTGYHRGSSPHARGPSEIYNRFPVEFRIIPACAGSITISTLSEFSRKDHPRMRGVHLVASRERLTKPGSSPHARGPLTIWTNTRYWPRIIPACAGSIGFLVVVQDVIEDHPRMRGVHVVH